MNKLEHNNTIELLSMICKRPKMYFENPTINNIFRFLDGYYMSQVIHTPKEEREKCDIRDTLFWSSFGLFLANKYNKEIANKNISSCYIVEHLLKEISADENIDFALFAENFNEFIVTTSIKEKYNADEAG
ncbi:hypothetical protein [Bacteroides faecium]|uniref:Uncharacterized protein n=1 Tax=Bacteroides faecium TaxID=2715212 RepID=A0A6H0KTL2_9BACE|nr:hypothetical protein [Bacteroides faecium]QIU96682.1 hypothetical protein BacF7301_22145 [Bacteroides faecium]